MVWSALAIAKSCSVIGAAGARRRVQREVRVAKGHERDRGAADPLVSLLHPQPLHHFGRGRPPRVRLPFLGREDLELLLP